MALRAGPLCLPKLAKLALYLKRTDENSPDMPRFTVDPASRALDHSAQSVCDALGTLVTAGVLPALAQARLSILKGVMILSGAFPTPPACSMQLSLKSVCLLQVLLYPCDRDSEYDSDWKGWRKSGGRGLQCGGAAGVPVTCRIVSSNHNKSAFALQKPELGSALNEAAQRALDSLDIALPDWEHKYGF